MYELIKLSEHDSYFDCPAKIGMVQTAGNRVVLIDSGSDKDAGKKVLKHLDADGKTPEAILNTHSHADHIGGNKLIQDRTDCKIFAPGLERAFTENTILEPACLYGGRPFGELKHKFLFAQESEAKPLTGDVLPEGMQLLPLPGHSPDMTGFLTPDGSAFIGDSVSSEQTLEKYGIGYLWDPEQSLRTLEFLRTLPARRFIPSHAEVTDDIEPLVQRNIEAIEYVKTFLLETLRQPLHFDELLKKVFDTFALTMNTQQYVLIGSTVRSYLSSLHDAGSVSFGFTDNRMIWQTN